MACVCWGRSSCGYSGGLRAKVTAAMPGEAVPAGAERWQQRAGDTCTGFQELHVGG